MISLALDLEYARFNAQKTVADLRPSRFTTRKLGALTLTGDAHRDDLYYHRVLGLQRENLDELDGVRARRVDVDACDVVARARRARPRPRAARGRRRSH